MAVKPLLPEQPFTVPEWELKRAEIKTRLFDTLGHPPEERNTREIKILGEEKLPHYTRQKLSYLVGANDLVSAYLLIPDKLEPPAPAVVAMHQTADQGKDEAAGISGDPDLAYGHELAELGYVVLIPDTLTAGERIIPRWVHGSPARFTSSTRSGRWSARTWKIRWRR